MQPIEETLATEHEDAYETDMNIISQALRRMASKNNKVKEEAEAKEEKIKELESLLHDCNKQIAQNVIENQLSRTMIGEMTELLQRTSMEKQQAEAVIKNLQEQLKDQQKFYKVSSQLNDTQALLFQEVAMRTAAQEQLKQAAMAREIAEEQLTITNDLLQKFKNQAAPMTTPTKAIISTQSSASESEIKELKVQLEAEKIQKHYMSLAVADTKRQATQEADELKAKIEKLTQELEESKRQLAESKAQTLQAQDEAEPLPEDFSANTNVNVEEATAEDIDTTEEPASSRQ
ncbi:hypothetical protein L7F22_016509 [Adiantum nelumboides]|nr:hypothetical protein [Adiantum nelumboides]